MAVPAQAFCTFVVFMAVTMSDRKNDMSQLPPPALDENDARRAVCATITPSEGPSWMAVRSSLG